MGRHNKRPTIDGDIRSKEHIKSGKTSEAAVERLGLNSRICMSCNARNDSDADHCRKCGHSQLRRKKKDYEDA